MHDLLIRDIQVRFAHAWHSPEIEGDIRDRLMFGLRKYGKSLQAHNGRNPVLDAYQEILDALVYFIQAMVETRIQSPADAARLVRIRKMYDEALEMAFELKSVLSGDC